MIQEKLALTGATVTAAAATINKFEVLQAMGDLAVTWLGVATGLATLAWYGLKFRDYIKMKREQRHAILQRDLEK